MKKTKVLKTFELQVDTVDYLFVEWLCRRGAFSAFKSNCGFSESSEVSFRAALRGLVRDALLSRGFGLGDLISVSFSFAEAPEGLAYWSGLSLAWRRFCIDFQNKFK